VLPFRHVSLILIPDHLSFDSRPFHAAVGIMTTRMHLHLVKFAQQSMDDGTDTEVPSIPPGEALKFV